MYSEKTCGEAIDFLFPRKWKGDYFGAFAREWRCSMSTYNYRIGTIQKADFFALPTILA